MIRILLLYFIWLRFQLVSLKPVHHDEAVNGQFIQLLWGQGFYNYDPNNYHGPFLIYLMGLSEKIFGWGIESIRLVPLIFSALWLWFLFRWTKTRFPSSRWLTLVLATSCAFLFFARSGIHEMVFVFFTTLALAGVIEVLDFRNSKGWLWLLWGVWGCFGLKETWALMAAAGGIALILIGLPTMWKVARSVSRPKWLGLHLGLAGLSWIYLFSNGFSDLSALAEFFKAFMPWTSTGVHGAGHEKSFWYWLAMIYQHEGPILFLWSICLAGLFWFRRSLSFGAQFLGWGSLVQFLIYSWIPYKTPWCLISILAPIVLFIIVSWRQVVGSWTLRTSVKIITLILAILAWKSTDELNFKTPWMKHDYVYVQTTPQLKKLVDYITEKAKQDAGLIRMKIQVGGTEPWPLAWWLVPFKDVRFMSLQSGLMSPLDLLVIDESESQAFEGMGMSHEFYKMIFPIRDARVNSVYYLRKSLFPDFPIGELQ